MKKLLFTILLIIFYVSCINVWGETISPKDFEVSATSEMVKIEGMVHKELPIWSFQPHIESSRTFATRIGVNSKDFEKTRPYSSVLLESFLKNLKY